MQMFQLDMKCTYDGCTCQRTSMQVRRKQQSNQVYHQQQQQRHSHNVKEEVSQTAIHVQSDDMELHETPLHGLVGKIEPQANSLFTGQTSRGKQFGDFLAQIHTPAEQCRPTESSLHMLMQQDHLRQMCQLYHIQQVHQLQLLRNQNKINYV